MEITMLHFYWSFASFLISLGILIIVHEFGHFLVARLLGVKVERFSIGLGPILISWMDKRGTKFVFSAIPLGGYVKMTDNMVDNVTSNHKNNAYLFKNATILQRAIIIAAGSICNLIFAFFVYWLVFMIGIPSYRPIVGDVTINSIALKAKILPGMELKSIDGIETPDWNSVRLQIINKIGNSEIKIGVLDTNSAHQVKIKTLDLRGWHFDSDKIDLITYLGIVPYVPRIEPVLAQVKKNSAAEKAGLKIGDRIIKADGQLVDCWSVFINKVRDNPERAITVSIERKDTQFDVILTPDIKLLGDSKPEGYAGIVPKVNDLPDQYHILLKFGPLHAMARAGEASWQLIRITGSILGKMITGNVSFNNIAGPISMARGLGISAEHGLVSYLMFLALISVNLGMTNLVPIPVLDGGHILFLVIEKLKGSPLSDIVQDICYRIGSVLLAMIMTIAIFNDIFRL